MDVGYHGVGIRNITLDLGNDGTDVPTNVGNISMRTPR